MGKQIIRQCKRLAFGERTHGAPCQDLGRRPHVERIAALKRKIVRAIDFDSHSGGPGTARTDGKGHTTALLGRKLERLRLISLQLGSSVGGYREVVVTRRAF